MESELAATLQTVLAALTLAFVKPFEGTFFGKGSSAKFLQDVESYFSENNVPLEKRLGIVVKALRGEAREWYDSVKDSLEFGSYDAFKSEFLKVYPKIVNRVTVESEIYSRIQCEGEATLSFVLRKVRLCREYFEGRSDEQIISLVKDRLLPPVQDFLDVRKIESVAQLIENVKLYDNRHPPPQAAETAAQVLCAKGNAPKQ